MQRKGNGPMSSLERTARRLKIESCDMQKVIMLPLISGLKTVTETKSITLVAEDALAEFIS